MKTPIIFVVLAFFFPITTHSFHIIPSRRSKSIFSCASDTNSNDAKPNLVDQTSFLTAVETVKKASGIDTSTADPNISYAIGRLTIQVTIPPGIDLVETPELVLINGVSQDASDAGIKPLDTIVQVSATDGSFVKSTKAVNMDDMFQIIQEAMAHAREQGQTEIEMEVNRLVQGYYK